jgi:hypothetical protein
MQYDYPTEFGFLKLMHSLRGRYLPVIETAMEIVWHWIQKILGLQIFRRGTLLFKACCLTTKFYDVSK